MPRIYASDNDPLDFCKSCFPKSEDEAFDEYGHWGHGPDDRGSCFAYDASHPPYGFDPYNCFICGETLLADDE